jgi:hypothetical protein
MLLLRGSTVVDSTTASPPFRSKQVSRQLSKVRNIFTLLASLFIVIKSIVFSPALSHAYTLKLTHRSLETGR